jgi:3-phenylpropionate/trans-cinnamate dioxygenase ferredoxin reductase component
VRGFWTTIGAPTVKYHAWGDGYQRSQLLERDDGFTVWYEVDGRAVGVLRATRTTTTSWARA